ncbi:hypothetical protein [Cellulosimicrobium cellulans]|uniref:hypothetical protein n=1 Tax=Cellulosimicrobium cellulans TaxID=1710 RepID=UPI001C0DBBF1|nr:hypothetical protein [Cellulosimicrobium cellulans]
MRIRNTFSTTTTALATSALLVLGLAACGSGDDEAAPAEETTKSAEATEESPAEEETPAEETEEPQAEGGDADICAASATLEEMSSEMGNIDPNNPQAGLDTLEQLTSTLEGVEPPAEIAGDWSTMATTFRSVTDGLSSALADPTAPDAMTKVSDAMSAMTEESFQQAGQNVTAYTATNC